MLLYTGSIFSDQLLLFTYTPRANFTNLPLLSNQTDVENNLVRDKSFSYTNKLCDTSRTSKLGYDNAESLESCEESYASVIKNYVHICFKYKKSTTRNGQVGRGLS